MIRIPGRRRDDRQESAICASMIGMKTAQLTIAGKTYGSRLIVGSGKYASFAQTRQALDASGAEMITVAVRRVNITDPSRENLLDHLDLSKVTILPNTAGCSTAEEAVRTARLAREAGIGNLVKLEVIGDAKTLFPDNEATLAAARVLAAEGFAVLPYVNDDVIMAKKLRDAGCAAIMPLAAPIGSGLGIQNAANLRLILEEITDLPVIVDAGVGTASDAAIAMEMGVDGILMNTAIAGATDPIRMARAMRLAVESGRLAFEAGRIPRKLYATASSPLEGVVR
jgi:thiazole synthase